MMLLEFSFKFDSLKDVIGAVADSLSIITSGIAIWLYFKEKDKIFSFIKAFTSHYKNNYLSVLLNKVEELNKFDYETETDKKEIQSIFHEIQGQILGNSFLKEQLEEELKEIQKILKSPNKFTTASKRGLTSLLRSKIEHLKNNNQVDSI